MSKKKATAGGTLKNRFGRFEKYKDVRGKFRWRYKAGNGEIVFACTQGYARRADRDKSLRIAMGCDTLIKVVNVKR